MLASPIPQTWYAYLITLPHLGIPGSRYDLSVERSWLKETLAIARGSAPCVVVGLFPGASQLVKRWPEKRWTELARNLTLLPHVECRLISGKSSAERAMASRISTTTQLASDRRGIRKTTTDSLVDLVSEMAQLHFLITNDTLPLHLGIALGVPVVGIYLATDASIWGEASEHFVPVQSRVGLNCPAMQTEMGSCIHYYGGCPGPCADDVTVARVWRAFEILLTRT
jgi:ADP-heptose:LPS heptosyltransferase